MIDRMKELRRITPTFIGVGLIVMSLLVCLALAAICPVAAFALGAGLWLCYIDFVIDLPAISRKEEPLYGDNPEEFIDMKVKLTMKMWGAGILLMVIIFAAGVALSYLEETINPELNFVSASVVFMISIAPFIPATFILMKASYVYDDSTMGMVTIAIIGTISVGTVILMVFLLGTPDEYVPYFPVLEVFPNVPIGIGVLAASLLTAFFLSKSAKKSFIRYAKNEVH